MGYESIAHEAEEYNCRKNFDNAPLDTKKHRKTTPYLWPKMVETYSPSKASDTKPRRRGTPRPSLS